MSERILRTKETMERLGVKRTAFFENFILTERLKKIRLTSRAVGFLESEVNQIIAELAADRLPPRR